MEENQFNNAPRKIRKIKRPRVPENQPATYGVPEKISEPQNSLQSETVENYYDANGDAENIRFVTDEDLMPQEPETVTYFLKNKTVLLMLVLATLFGTVLGSTMFSTQETAKKGLDGVVVNSDVPVGRSRCGLVFLRAFLRVCLQKRKGILYNISKYFFERSVHAWICFLP